MSQPLDLVASRVASLRQRHAILCAVFALVAALPWAAPDGELPITGKAVIALALLAAAAWQGWLGLKIGRGLAIVRAAQPVVWIYELRASINGSVAGVAVMIGLPDGSRHELPTDGPELARRVIEALTPMYPSAALGWDEAKEKRFLASPTSVRDA